MKDAKRVSLPSGTDRRLNRWWRATVRCRLCTTIAPWRKFPPTSHGTRRSGLMILGEAPGRVSLDNGRGFSNPRNLTIRRAFARAVAPKNLQLEDLVYLTDTVKCWPASPSGANRGPRESEVRRCITQHLGPELALVKPRTILAFGARAAHAALGHPVKLSLDHGKVSRNLMGVRVIPLMHPSTRNIAGMRRAGIFSLADYENRLARLIRSELQRLLPGGD
jgi:uracil-DNA glycosylase